jgi:hypothetical protein
MKILKVIYEFTNNDFNTTCGLYHVELDSKAQYYLLRNHDSVGVITHILSSPASECISIIRDDVKDQFLKLLEE